MRKERLLFVFCSTVVFLLVLLWQFQFRPAFGQEEKTIEFAYKDRLVRDIIRDFAKEVGKNFIIPQSLANVKVTIVTGKPIPASEAFKVLETILASQQFSMVETEHFIKIFSQKVGEGKAEPTPIFVGKEEEKLEGENKLVTVIVVLEYIDVNEILVILSALRSPGAIIHPFRTINTLVIKDTEANAKYLLSIIKKLDVKGTIGIVTIIRLKYSSARDMTSILWEIISTRGLPAVVRPPIPRTQAVTGGVAFGRPGAVKIIPDERTNSLIIVATEAHTEYILDLIKRIDVEAPPEFYPIHVYQCNNQKAEDLAKVLEDFARRRTAEAKAAAVPVGRGEVFFIAEKNSNTILIQAPPQDWEIYKLLLEKLDQPQRQVLIEVWVIEISSTDQFSLGVEIQSSEPAPGERIGPRREEILGGTDYGLGLRSTFSKLSEEGLPGSGVTLGVRTLLDKRLRIGDRVYSIPDFDTLIRALEQHTDVNVLASPKILTLNNKEATVEIIDEISILTSEVTTTEVAGAVTSAAYKRTPIGITLTLLPQINFEDFVIMDIDLKADSIVGVPVTEAGALPVVAKRVTKNSVRVENHQTIVISGLRRSDKTKSVSKVPLLGSIPLIGALFRSKATLEKKTNLLVFITPHIVTETPEMLQITEQIKNQNLEKERYRFEPLKAKKRKGKKLKKRLPETNVIWKR